MMYHISMHSAFSYMLRSEVLSQCPHDNNGTRPERFKTITFLGVLRVMRDVLVYHKVYDLVTFLSSTFLKV